VRAVNLLPRDESQGRGLPSPPVLVACGGTVLLTAALAVMFLSASSTVGKRRQALADAQVRLAAVPAPAPPSPIVASLPQQRQERVTALAAVLSQRIAFDRILREVSQVVPSDVWLESLGASAPLQAAPGAVAPTTTGLPTGFTISGYTYSQEAVARFLARLEVVPDLVEVTLNTSGGTKIGTRSVVQFTISANVRAPGATS
jgi:Tfp pilus assembly protein PilN